MNGPQRATAIDLLGQRERWIDTHGTLHQVQDMDRRYCENVYGYLLRNGRGIAEQLYHRVTFGPQPNGEMAQDAVNAILEELLDAIDNPEQWMARQPLMEALADRIGSGASDVGLTREVTVVVKLKVPVNQEIDSAQRSFERTMKNSAYGYEVVAFTD